MLKFKKFLDETLLSESLDSPVEYEFTKDTQPNLKRIYAVFSLDDTTYGMSLEESNHDGIYLLKFYRIVNSKGRHWSFRKPNHVRKGLSTLLKFVDDVMPKIKHRVDGVITRIPNKRNSERVVELSERIIRRSFITSFRTVPIRKTEDAKYNYLFIIRKLLNPVKVFKSKSFSGYDFDPEEQVMPTNIADEIVPKRREKRTYNITPAKGLGFENLTIQNVEIDDEIIEQISQVRNVEKIEKQDKQDNNIIDFGDFTDKDLKDAEEKLENSIEGGLTNLVNPFIANDKHIVSLLVNLSRHTESKENLDYLMENFFKTDDIEEKKKIFSNWLDLIEIRMRNMFSSNDVLYDILGKRLPMSELEISLHNYMVYSENTPDQFNSEPFTKEVYDKIVNSEGEHEAIKSALDNLIAMAKNEKLQKDYKLIKKPDEVLTSETFKSNIDVESLTSNLPGQGEFDYDKLTNEMNIEMLQHGIEEIHELISKKQEYILHDLGYDQLTNQISDKEKIELYSYTDGAYSKRNYSLRKAARDFFVEGNNELPVNVVSDMNKSIRELTNIFNKVEPLKEPIWVYRDADAPDKLVEGLFEGRDYIDPAFLSTTYQSSFHFNPTTSIRFRIYLPRGSKIIIPGEISEFPYENEVILPPFSVLTTIRIDKFKIDHVIEEAGLTRHLVTSVYAGSAYDDFRDQIENAGLLKENNLIYNLKENQEEKNNKKFSDSMDEDLGEKLQELIKNKKIKIKKHKK